MLVCFYASILPATLTVVPARLRLLFCAPIYIRYVSLAFSRVMRAHERERERKRKRKRIVSAHFPENWTNTKPTKNCYKLKKSKSHNTCIQRLQDYANNFFPQLFLQSRYCIPTVRFVQLHFHHTTIGELILFCCLPLRELAIHHFAMFYASPALAIWNHCPRKLSRFGTRLFQEASSRRQCLVWQLCCVGWFEFVIYNLEMLPLCRV